jgi:outer membrane protein assembly factor BamB
LWRYDPEVSGTNASPVIIDGVVYVTVGMLGGGSLIALDLATGENLWSTPIEFEPFGSTPAVVDGVIYLAGIQGDVAAIDLETQKERWSTKLDAGTSSSPVVVDDLLYIGADDDQLYALDVADGAERWRFTVGEGASYTLGPSPAVADGAVFYANASSEAEKGLFALAAVTGDEVWHFEPEEPGLFTPAIVDDTLYVGGDGGDVYAIDVATGEERWKSTVSSAWSTPAVADDAVFVQTMAGSLACLDRETGDIRWEAATPASWCSPVIAGDTVYVGAEALWFEMGLYALDRATGEQRWYMRVDGVMAPVAISGEALVVASSDGAVCAVGGSHGDAVERGTDGEGAFLTPIVFSTEVDEWNMPIDPADTLPADTSQLIAGFDYVGLKFEAAWEAVWTLDGEPLATRTDSWAQGSSGRVTEQITANEGSLSPGRYGLELRVDGTPIRRGEVVIG